MKKINVLFTFLIALTILSCSSDDNNNSDNDPIVGVWKPIKEIETYNDNSTIEFEYTACQQRSRFTYNANGTANIVEFVNDEITGDCVQRTDPVLTSANWEKSENGKYRLITTHKYNVTSQIYTTDKIPDVFEFENNNNTLSIGYNDDEIIEGKQLKSYHTVFVRVE
ncbi:hypothetical protein ACFFU1_10050 [Algibacter miyuki]|uniref:Lipocalin-like domain-containing protein n=1 Tax=Algibacter miyuki TaxID=1306933 RepID=A0ABV5H026_9FLAO|nr:hypothetical protein [Algibacter miyuki]MDN3667523.1 hypothetical protein [Algibacter miyuki]